MTKQEQLVEKLKNMEDGESIEVCGREVKASYRYYHVGVHRFQFAEDCVQWILANIRP